MKWRNSGRNPAWASGWPQHRSNDCSILQITFNSCGIMDPIADSSDFETQQCSVRGQAILRSQKRSVLSVFLLKSKSTNYVGENSCHPTCSRHPLMSVKQGTHHAAVQLLRFASNPQPFEPPSVQTVKEAKLLKNTEDIFRPPLKKIAFACSWLGTCWSGILDC